MAKPRFHNSDGKLTRYALACGYVQAFSCHAIPYRVEIASPKFDTMADRFRVELTRDACTYAVKLIDITVPGVVAWECYDTLTDARSAYRNGVAWARRMARNLGGDNGKA